ncbi:MAG: hypothetical protein COA71_04535 [SAR86 cluster bacterium]|uniref:Protein TonB n=1 Tax=SAR86 cluster bacterium TaxID=2030880 RepID=A0A2A5CFW9_9GAMM|nr:MAG: hypothetical protein COA71_04535 [SAR86 cluster bacterium]
MKKLGLILLLSVSALTANLSMAENVVPILDVAPEYPQSALRRETTGYVVVRFDVNENGKAKNFSIVEASPEHIFNSAVRTAVMRSTFGLVDGSSSASVERTYHFDHSSDTNVTNRFNFMEEAPQLVSN